MESISDRMQKRMRELGLKQADIVRATGAGRTTVSNWYNGNTSPTGDFPAQIAKLLKVDTTWLLTGQSQRELESDLLADEDQSLKIRLKHLLGIPQDTTFDLSGLSEQYHSASLDAEHNILFGDKMPVISWVAAGDWDSGETISEDNIDDVEDWIPRPEYFSKKSFALQVKGSSMRPYFEDGHFVLIETKVDIDNLKDGDLVIMHCDDEGGATFKKIVISPNGKDKYLEPLNRDWHTQQYRPIGDCRLIGVVQGQYIDWRRKKI